MYRSGKEIGTLCIDRERKIGHCNDQERKMGHSVSIGKGKWDTLYRLGKENGTLCTDRERKLGYPCMHLPEMQRDRQILHSIYTFCDKRKTMHNDYRESSHFFFIRELDVPPLY